MRDISTHSRQGFTLLELAIVLVVIGLLVGGILGGQSLLRSVDLKNILNDAVTYRSSANQFQQQYGYLPGDFPAATQVWGDDAAACADAALTDGNPGTCNGNGDTSINNASAANSTGEIFQYWKQLQLGGYIQGRFTGLNGPGHANYHMLPGTNVPTGSITNSGFGMYSWGYQVAGVIFYEGDYTNTMTFGKTTANNWPYGGALTPEEQFSLDQKVDDGYPGFGSIRTMAKTFMDAIGNTNCISSDTASAAAYVLTTKSQACLILFMPAFKSPSVV